MKLHEMIKHALSPEGDRVDVVAALHALADQGTPAPHTCGAACACELQGWERDLVAPGHGDSVIMFRRALLQRETQGVTLRDAFDRLTATHPQVGAAVAEAGSGGMIMWERAVEALATYEATGVASAPVLPRSL